jgi:hypothetical protein
MVPTESRQPPQVPSGFGGRWIAWNYERTKIVADGTTLIKANSAANLAGEARPFLTKVPDPNVRFVGELK